MKTNGALISDRDDKIFVLIKCLPIVFNSTNTSAKKSFRYEEVAPLHKLYSIKNGPQSKKWGMHWTDTPLHCNDY